MRITHIITRLILGGAQEVVIRTCAEQVRRGHKVSLVHGPIHGPEGSLLEQARASGADVVEVPTLVRPVQPWKDMRCYRQLRGLIHGLGPDVVHTHSSKAGILGRAAAWAQAVPCVVHTVHGLAFHDRQPALVRHAFIQAERFAARRCHHLIAVSPRMVEAFVAHRIARADQCTVIPSAVDLERFEGVDPVQHRRAAREEMGIDQAALVVGILARVDRLKGHDDLLDILPMLIERFPTLHVLFVGSGYHQRALERRAREEMDKDMARRVIFTGLISPAEVARIMPAVDLSVLPSYQEGQSLTLAESLLCGCGIVGYDTGGIARVCIDGQTGRLVPRGDKTALAEAIGWMLHHPHERRRLTDQGQTHVRQLLDPIKMTDDIEKVYRSVISK